MSNDNNSDRDVVVVDRGGSSLGVIIGVILVIILAGGIWYFGFGPGQGTFGGTDQGNDINVNVELPSVAPDAS
jgi:hypothetical protein